jgi:threonine aldolase
MSNRSVELRSDTFTRPTAGMRRAMAEAEVGDDVWNEDPTVHRLEARAADLTGKEAALFVSSGTQGNLIGILSHTERGDEIVIGDQSHVFRYEVGGTAVVGGLQVYALPNTARGRIASDAVRAAIRGSDIHEPRTGCIALENTHNRCGGAVLRVDEVAEIADIAHDRGVPLHLDGARVFNAATALGVPVSAITAPVDSVTFCLSKGLGAPVGSLLCGSTGYIARARKWRKLLGGGMRQAGVLAAAGLYVLDEHVERLAEDHANARLLAEGLAEIPGIRIDLTAVESNLVFFEIDGLEMEIPVFLERLSESGVRLGQAGSRVRAVTSYEASRADIEFALEAVRAVAHDPVGAAL